LYFQWLIYRSKPLNEMKTGSEMKTEVMIPAALGKVNLGLAVLGRMQNGLHALESLVCPISLADRLELTLLPGMPEKRTCEVQFSDELFRHVEESLGAALAAQALEGLCSRDNLAARAVELMMSAHSDLANHGYCLKISKQIPFEAGLGGGSADAAAVLLGLAAHLNQSALDEPTLSIASTLGADVPVLLLREIALMCGSGRRVRRFPPEVLLTESIGKRWLLIAKPPRGVSTARAYVALNKSLIGGGEEIGTAVESFDLENHELSDVRIGELLGQVFPIKKPGNSEDSQGRALTYAFAEGRCLSPRNGTEIPTAREGAARFNFFNDFEPVVSVFEPQIAQTIRAVQSLGACSEVVLSGSGSAVVGTVADELAARNAVIALRKILPSSWFLTSACLLPRECP
jgi:4-diphosphocytidyl-2-C-methyl-D-erythritol kinase